LQQLSSLEGFKPKEARLRPSTPAIKLYGSPAAKSAVKEFSLIDLNAETPTRGKLKGSLND
jgi:hypothetical protein